MSEITSALNYDAQTNAQAGQHAVSAGAAGDAAAHASTDGANLGAAHGLDASAGAVDVSGALDAAGAATPDGGALSLSAALDGMLDVVGALVAQFSGSLTAALGF